jgi:hypothetical protein
LISLMICAAVTTEGYRGSSARARLQNLSVSYHFAAAQVLNGMGSRTTSPSPREQFIEDVVRLVIPHLAKATFGLREPGGALRIVRQSLYRNADMSVFRQCQWLERTQHPVFVDDLDRGSHLRNLLSQRRSSNNRLALFRGAEASTPPALRKENVRCAKGGARSNFSESFA